MVPEGWSYRTVAEILEKVSNPVDVDSSATYQEIGIRSHGKGIFHKEPILGKNLGNKRVFHIEPDCFVVNIVFAWEQAIAKTSEAEVEMIASHRFPMFRPKSGLCDIDFILYYFNTKKGKSLLELASPGGAGRNKTLGQSEFAKLGLLLPSVEEQKKIAQILSTWDKAITTTEQLLANSQQQKKALMQQLLTGKKRLLDKNGVRFSGGWRFLTFDEAFKVANKKSAQVKSSDYFATGSVPVVDQGKELIAGYCDNDERYTNVPVIIFGDHTRCLKWVDFEFCPGADGTQVLDSKEFLDKKFGYYLLCHTDIPNLGYSRHMRELKEKDFKVPVDMVEQQKIAAVLSSADQEISALQQKLDALKQEKKALMQQLLTGKRRVLVS
ncbi:restriction endonuclease subunit S [Shewanella algae]|uniref:restriction endonuclease subunit S n=1 Tax=Shewanella algae TaxID=38313 RepID=UPI000D14FD73|nr:restriction endonuclease subunit S [Shewanella algae]